MEYQGYIGKVEFDEEADLFHGEVINIRDTITFQGKSVAELKKAFRDSVDDYLDFCKQRGELPDKPFSGQFVTRIPADLHRQVNLAAELSGKSLNAWVGEQLQAAVMRTSKKKTSKVASNSKSQVKNKKSPPKHLRKTG